VNYPRRSSTARVKHFANSHPFLVEDFLRHLLVQSPNQDHRPVQVLSHPAFLGPTAATDGLLEGSQDVQPATPSPCCPSVRGIS